MAISKFSGGTSESGVVSGIFSAPSLPTHWHIMSGTEFMHIWPPCIRSWDMVYQPQMSKTCDLLVAPVYSTDKSPTSRVQIQL